MRPHIPQHAGGLDRHRLAEPPRPACIGIAEAEQTEQEEEEDRGCDRARGERGHRPEEEAVHAPGEECDRHREGKHGTEESREPPGPDPAHDPGRIGRQETLGPMASRYQALISDAVKDDTRKLTSFEAYEKGVTVASESGGDWGP